MNTGSLDDEVQQIPSQGIPSQLLSFALQPGYLASSAMSPWEIAEDYMWGIRTSGGADAYDDGSTLELFRRAIVQSDQDTRRCLERGLGEIMRDWLHRHPRSEEACRLGSEEGYVAQTFECFWQAVADWRLQASTSLPTVLRYLQACLQGVLLDALRSKARPKGIPLQEPADSEGQPGGDHPGAHQLWERIQGLFPDVREQRVAYLLFHCHLSPREIFCLAPHQFRDVQKICHLRARILERILLHSDLMALLLPLA